VALAQTPAPPPPPPAYGAPITLEQAKKVMAGAEAEARTRSLRAEPTCACCGWPGRAPSRAASHSWRTARSSARSASPAAPRRRTGRWRRREWTRWS